MTNRYSILVVTLVVLAALLSVTILGWGWALFKADAPDVQVATDFKKDCLGCHIPAQQTEWVYVNGYPVLVAT
jgi:hypothetical protein